MNFFIIGSIVTVRYANGNSYQYMFCDYDKQSDYFIILNNEWTLKKGPAIIAFDIMGSQYDFPLELNLKIFNKMEPFNYNKSENFFRKNPKEHSYYKRPIGSVITL